MAVENEPLRPDTKAGTSVGVSRPPAAVQASTQPRPIANPSSPSTAPKLQPASAPMPATPISQVPPPAAVHDIPRWEYRIIQMPPMSAIPKDIEIAFNALGMDGWELTHFFSRAPAERMQVVFKRPKRDL